LFYQETIDRVQDTLRTSRGRTQLPGPDGYRLLITHDLETEVKQEPPERASASLYAAIGAVIMVCDGLEISATVRCTLWESSDRARSACERIPTQFAPSSTTRTRRI